MMGRCRLRVVKDVNGRRYRYQRPGPLGRPASRIGQFDPDTVLGDRYRGYGQLVVIQLFRDALVGHVGVMLGGHDG